MSGFGIWLAVAAALILGAVAIPYGLMSGDAGFGVLAVWTAFGLAVVALIAAGLARWR